MSDLRIYVACLASYNSGVLHGEWIDCEGKDADELQEEVNAILRSSPHPNVMVECPTPHWHGQAAPLLPTCPTCKGVGSVPSAEEWAIHDFEGFGDLLSEHSSFDEVARHAEMIEEHGDAWIAYCDHVGAHYATAEDFRDAYHGTWDSEEAYAEHLIDEGMLGEIPDALISYIDTERVARDLFLGDYWRDDDTGAVFRR
jgi:antirestriction protein